MELAGQLHQRGKEQFSFEAGAAISSQLLLHHHHHHRNHQPKRMPSNSHLRKFPLGEFTKQNFTSTFAPMGYTLLLEPPINSAGFFVGGFYHVINEDV